MLDISQQAQAIFEILSAVYGTSPWKLEQILVDLEASQTDYFYVYNAGSIIGFLAIQDLMGEFEITNIAVHPDYQGQGYGHQLMNKLTDYPERFFLEVRASNQAAQQLYKTYGFKEVGKRKAYYHEPVDDAIIMVREG